MDPTTYCLLRHEVPEAVVDLLELIAIRNIQVIRDRRRGHRRNEGRRASAAPRGAVPIGPASGCEQRRVRNPGGRRVAERRMDVVPQLPPPGLDPLRVRWEGSLQFFRRPLLPADELEDIQAKRLIVQFQAGEADAADELYKRYQRMLYRYHFVVLRDHHEAEDAAHEVFLRVLQALPRYEIRSAPFRVWLFRVARNHVLNARAKRSRLEPTEPSNLMLCGEDRGTHHGHLGLVGKTRPDEFLAVTQELSVAQRQVLFLRYVVDLDVAEIGRVLGISKNAVCNLQYRAFQALRETLSRRATQTPASCAAA